MSRCLQPARGWSCMASNGAKVQYQAGYQDSYAPPPYSPAAMQYVQAHSAPEMVVPPSPLPKKRGLTLKQIVMIIVAVIFAIFLISVGASIWFWNKASEAIEYHANAKENDMKDVISDNYLDCSFSARQNQSINQSQNFSWTSDDLVTGSTTSSLKDSKSALDQNTYVDAVKGNQLDLVKKCLNNGQYVDCKDKFGDTPLSNAVAKGKLEMVRLLLDRNANIHQRDKFQKSLLDIAVENEEAAIVKLLLERGANVNSKGFLGASPLILAIERDNYEIVKMLIEKGAQVDAKGRLNQTALLKASRQGQRNIVELLLKNGARSQISEALKLASDSSIKALLLQYS